jgi:hypothetical protein
MLGPRMDLSYEGGAQGAFIEGVNMRSTRIPRS